jgi:hypothetical protein
LLLLEETNSSHDLVMGMENGSGVFLEEMGKARKGFVQEVMMIGVCDAVERESTVFFLMESHSVLVKEKQVFCHLDEENGAVSLVEAQLSR